MSVPVTPLRSSCQATIAPPCPSATIAGALCPPTEPVSDVRSVSSARPSAGHAGSVSPADRTRRAKMLTFASRRSSPTMIAPPLPSDAIAGCCCVPTAVATPRPDAGHSARAKLGERDRPNATGRNTLLELNTRNKVLIVVSSIDRKLHGDGARAMQGRDQLGACEETQRCDALEAR